MILKSDVRRAGLSRTTSQRGQIGRLRRCAISGPASTAEFRCVGHPRAAVLRIGPSLRFATIAAQSSSPRKVNQPTPATCRPRLFVIASISSHNRLSGQGDQRAWQR